MDQRLRLLAFDAGWRTDWSIWADADKSKTTLQLLERAYKAVRRTVAMGEIMFPPENFQEKYDAVSASKSVDPALELVTLVAGRVLTEITPELLTKWREDVDLKSGAVDLGDKDLVQYVCLASGASTADAAYGVFTYARSTQPKYAAYPHGSGTQFLHFFTTAVNAAPHPVLSKQVSAQAIIDVDRDTEIRLYKDATTVWDTLALRFVDKTDTEITPKLLEAYHVVSKGYKDRAEQVVQAEREKPTGFEKPKPAFFATLFGMANWELKRSAKMTGAAAGHVLSSVPVVDGKYTSSLLELLSGNRTDYDEHSEIPRASLDFDDAFKNSKPNTKAILTRIQALETVTPEQYVTIIVSFYEYLSWASDMQEVIKLHLNQFNAGAPTGVPAKGPCLHEWLSNTDTTPYGALRALEATLRSHVTENKNIESAIAGIKLLRESAAKAQRNAVPAAPAPPTLEDMWRAVAVRDKDLVTLDQVKGTSDAENKALDALRERFKPRPAPAPAARINEAWLNAASGDAAVAQLKDALANPQGVPPENVAVKAVLARLNADQPLLSERWMSTNNQLAVLAQDARAALPRANADQKNGLNALLDQLKVTPAYMPDKWQTRATTQDAMSELKNALSDVLRANATDDDVKRNVEALLKRLEGEQPLLSEAWIKAANPQAALAALSAAVVDALKDPRVAKNQSIEGNLQALQRQLVVPATWLAAQGPSEALDALARDLAALETDPRPEMKNWRSKFGALRLACLVNPRRNLDSAAAFRLMVSKLQPELNDYPRVKNTLVELDNALNAAEYTGTTWFTKDSAEAALEDFGANVQQRITLDDLPAEKNAMLGDVLAVIDAGRWCLVDPANKKKALVEAAADHDIELDAGAMRVVLVDDAWANAKDLASMLNRLTNAIRDAVSNKRGTTDVLEELVRQLNILRRAAGASSLPDLVSALHVAGLTKTTTPSAYELVRALLEAAFRAGRSPYLKMSTYAGAGPQPVGAQMNAIVRVSNAEIIEAALQMMRSQKLIA